MKTKIELLEMVDNLQYDALFEELSTMGFGREANRLKEEFILRGSVADIDWHKRLKVVIGDFFDPEPKNISSERITVDNSQLKDVYYPNCVDFAARQNTRFVLFVGMPATGKSNLIKGLLRNIATRKDATYNLHGDINKNYVVRARFYVNRSLIQSDEVITKPTQSASTMELDIEFLPNGKPSKSFTFLETGGEAHKSILSIEDEYGNVSKGKLVTHIDTYLLCPHVKDKVIIFVVSADASEHEANQSIDLVNSYLDYLNEIGVTDSLIYLLIVSKWDNLPMKGINVATEEILNTTYKLIHNRLNGIRDRIGGDRVHFSKFSLGHNIRNNKITDWVDKESPREKYASSIIETLYRVSIKKI